MTMEIYYLKGFISFSGLLVVAILKNKSATNTAANILNHQGTGKAYDLFIKEATFYSGLEGIFLFATVVTFLLTVWNW